VREPGDEIPEKPTPEQELRMRLWLEERVAAILYGKSTPGCGDFLETAISADIDFSALYLEYGFQKDGFTLAVDFREIQKRRGAF
jgi:hypothetical protein